MRRPTDSRACRVNALSVATRLLGVDNSLVYMRPCHTHTLVGFSRVSSCLSTENACCHILVKLPSAREVSYLRHLSLISRPLIAIVEGALLFPPSANTWIIGGRDNYTAPAPMEPKPKVAPFSSLFRCDGKGDL